MFDRDYGGIIWTNHALERLGQRGLTQKLAWEAFKHPTATLDGKNHGTIEFQRKVHDSLITVIAKKNEKKEWIILSCWIDPPLPGSIDIRTKEEQKKFQKASSWGKFWLTVKKQLGL